MRKIKLHVKKTIKGYHYTPVLLGLLIVIILFTFVLKSKVKDDSNNDKAPTPTISTAVINNEDTSNWKIYTNTKHHYSVKYPSTFDYYSSPIPESEYPTLNHVSFSGLGTGRYGGVIITLQVIDNNTETTSFTCSSDAQCLDERLKSLSRSKSMVSSTNKNILGKRREGFFDRSNNKLYFQEFENYAFIEKNKTWSISITTTDIEIKDIAPTVDQIISTLEFTK